MRVRGAMSRINHNTAESAATSAIAAKPSIVERLDRYVAMVES